MTSFTSLAPCRICLFGEHQDYLDLPVVAVSIPLYVRIRVTRREDRVVRLEAPEYTKEYNLDHLPGTDSRNPDFMLAALSHAMDDGWKLPGATLVSSSDLPMNRGCSTSSAFLVALIQALRQLAQLPSLTPIQVAQRAHKSEVTHWGAPGGTMDHVTSSVGGLLRINGWEVTPLTNQVPGVWVLADSGENKDTLGHLHRCKDSRLVIFEKMDRDWDHADDTTLLNENELLLLQATRTNRDTERAAARLLSSDAQDCGPQLGRLLSEHHGALRDQLLLSTATLEQLNKASMDAGAWGFKVVGSGGGGCGVAWTGLEEAERVQHALMQAGAAHAWIIDQPSPGAHLVFEE